MVFHAGDERHGGNYGGGGLMPDNVNFEQMETMGLQIGPFFMVIPISWREEKL